jgi:TM2 domain-containing membrane protein YozV
MQFIRMSEEKTKYCPYCGVQIEHKYTLCPSCGKPQPQIEGVTPTQLHQQRKNPTIAVVLSLLITGAGQIYLGKVGRGLVFLVGTLLLSILLEGMITFEETLIIGAAISIVSAWDAYRIAKQINES